MEMGNAAGARCECGGSERGGAVGALYAGYEFLSSMAQSPEPPEAMAAGCEAMAWMLYEAAEKAGGCE